MDPLLKKYNFVLLVATILLTSRSGVTSVSVCDNELCSCTPIREPVSISCNCNARTENLTFTHDQLISNFGKTRNVKVTNCNGYLTFKMNSFKELSQLESLVLQNNRYVLFESGVFHQLSKLALNNTQDLHFEERAFIGATGLNSIKIQHAVIPQLSLHSFFNINGLQELNLFNVSIRHIKKDAMKIKLKGPRSQVIINNCTMDNIEENGIAIETTNFSIIDSHLDNVQRKGIAARSSQMLLVSGSTFGVNFYSDSISMKSTVVNISNNVFQLLPTEILADIELSSNGNIAFVNNTVDVIATEGDLESVIEVFFSAEIRDNRLPCKTCTFIQTIGFFPNDSSIIQNNFCNSRCDVSLSEVVEMVRAGKVCTLNPSENPTEDILCSKSISVLPTMSIPSHHTQEGRGQHFHTTTPVPTTTVDSNSSDRPQFVPAIVLAPLLAFILKQ